MLAVAALVLAAPGADAQIMPGGPDGIPPGSIATTMSDNGDRSGLRKWLNGHGITYALNYTGEALGNLSGGVKRGGIYEGKLEAIIAADLEKLMGLQGLSFFTNGFQIHRTEGLRDHHFLSHLTISNIEAMSTTRLSELWLEQKFLDGRMSFRVGQLAADAEFFNSDYFKTFLSSDWPAIAAANLPNGGPAYPMATPGMRWRFDPNHNWSALVALFNGDPGDQATVDHTGTAFRVKDPPLLMTELQYRHDQSPDAPGLAGGVKIGGWHHFGRFDDQRFDIFGRSLADPLSTGIARQFRGTTGVYGVIDQQLYRPVGGAADSGITVFSRISATQPDRNLVSFCLDGGVIFSGMLPGRPDDKFGATFLFARMSDRARALDADMIAFSGISQPLRDYEATIEMTYTAQVKPGWFIQPTFQYVFHPGGHAPDPNNPTMAIRSGAVVGVRTIVSY